MMLIEILRYITYIFKDPASNPTLSEDLSLKKSYKVNF